MRASRECLVADIREERSAVGGYVIVIGPATRVTYAA
jgi:hypothetical protein